MEKDRIGIACAGGKAPGWPAGIKAITEVAEDAGFEPVGIENGFEGLAVPDAIFRNIHTFGDQSKFFFSNESPIFSSRYTPFNKKNKNGETNNERDERALIEFNSSKEKSIIVDNIKRNRIKCLIIMGGDDSVWTLNMLIKAGIIEGNLVPKTIDNDLTETLTHGHITAGHVGREIVDGIRIEAETFNRIGIIESMGRYASHLAMQHHNADIILPAKEIVAITKEQIQQRVMEIFEKNGKMQRGNPKKGSGVLVVAEGFLIDGEETFISTKEDDHGHKKLGGVGNRIQNWLEEVGLETTYQRPGYLYRFTPPLPECATLTTKLAIESTTHAVNGNTGISSIARNNGNGDFDIGYMPLSKIHGGKLMDPDDYDLDQLMPKHHKLIAE